MKGLLEVYRFIAVCCLTLISTILSLFPSKKRSIPTRFTSTKTRYLQEAFRRLITAEQKDTLVERSNTVESALFDIQLLGDEEQIIWAFQYTHNLNTTGQASLKGLSELFDLDNPIKQSTQTAINANNS